MLATDTITIVFADDHQMAREGFQSMTKKLSEIEILAVAFNGQELVEKVREHKPQVVITDIKMPVLWGDEAAKLIKAEFPDMPIIAISSHDEPVLIESIMLAGINGYLLKGFSNGELLHAIEQVLSGETYYTKEIEQKIIKLTEWKAEMAKLRADLTSREEEVMLLICEGKTNPEMAKELSIAKKTLEKFRQSLFRKTLSKTFAGVVLYAQKHGYLKNRNHNT